jgi:catechol 2,3-dioxygenase-like lactoylglutathione lyase family enzyme
MLARATIIHRKRPEETVISHVFVGVNQFDAAFAFYGGVMAELGLRLKFCEADKPRAAWQYDQSPRPLFIIGRPFDNASAHAGNGQMIALLASSTGMVERAYRRALATGGSCEGPPGLRPQYHAKYYGAYFRDPDGNKLCVCFHDA